MIKPHLFNNYASLTAALSKLDSHKKRHAQDFKSKGSLIDSHSVSIIGKLVL